MAGTKYSRQRESIREYLLSTKEHPTADMVYSHVRLIYPNISLGTVYRNLNQMAENGEILRLDLGDGTDHFDGTTSSHNHFICKCCHKVLDLEMEPIDHINTIASAGFDGSIEGHYTYFYGKCGECK